MKGPVNEKATTLPVDRDASELAFKEHARVILSRRGRQVAGVVIQVQPFARHPYLVHTADDQYARAKAEELTAC